METSHELSHVSQEAILGLETIFELLLQVAHKSLRLYACLRLKVVEELISQVGILGQHVIEIAEACLAKVLLLFDVSMHLGTLTLDVLDYFFLIGYPCFFLARQSVRYSLYLCSDGRQLISVVLYSIGLLLD